MFIYSNNHWIKNFELNKTAKCAVLDQIPRRPPPTFKPKTRGGYQYKYEFMKKSEAINQYCKQANDCECEDWLKSFDSCTEFQRWQKELYVKYKELKRNEKIMYLNGNILWKQKNKTSSRYSYGRNFHTLHCGSLGIYKYKLCGKMWRHLFSLNHWTSFRSVMSSIWNFRISKQMSLHSKDIHKPEPLWMDEFEQWFLKNVKYEESHYSNKRIPYLVILPQDVDNSGAQTKGQYLTASAKNMYANLFLLNTFLNIC